ncbi:MAG: tetratricopeptide repeat protein [Pirellulales bacterium]|nr:tetratricopeptide repeat protein [Pirellulales bacterium]
MTTDPAVSAPPPRAGIRAAVCIALAAACLLLYSRTLRYDFVNFDDFEYVANNPHINTGLRPENLVWVWTASVGANWHPLTVITHMIDSQIYGQRWVGGHHLTNIALHAANAVLLLLALAAMTGRFWPSALVAALFALHPLRVESVAWLSERKDVLCGCFWLASLWAYAVYVRAPSRGGYLTITVLLALGLMSKPMIVTAPALMLVLDYWPLARFGAADKSLRENLRQFGALVVEKLPWFALIAVSSGITFVVQSQGAVQSLKAVPPMTRVFNAIVAYGEYVVQFVWPTNMAVFYPHLSYRMTWFMIGRAILALVVVTLVAWTLRKNLPWLLSGWLWYLGTLVPAVGIVQVGGQSRADRYTYIPMIGITIMTVWTVLWWAQSNRARQRLLVAASIIWLAALAAVTWVQVGYWRNTKTLFQHAAEVVPRNFLAHRGVGNALAREGNHEEAIEHFELALSYEPGDWPSACNRGWALYCLGRYDEAETSMRKGIKQSIHPEDYFKLGLIELKRSRPQAAVKAFRTAIDKRRQRGEDWPDAFPYLVQAMCWAGDTAAAKDVLVERVRKYPKDALMLTELAWLLGTTQDIQIYDPRQAVEIARQACSLTFQHEVRSLDALAAALSGIHKYSEAVEKVEKAIEYNGIALGELDKKSHTYYDREWLDPAFDIRPDVRLLTERMRERRELYLDLKSYRHDPARGRF